MTNKQIQNNTKKQKVFQQDQELQDVPVVVYVLAWIVQVVRGEIMGLDVGGL